MTTERRAMAKALRRHLDGLRSLGVTALPAARGRPTPTSKAAALAHLVKDVQACRRCPLYETATQGVVSDGTPEAELVFIGEAPGREEDRQGKPFVGAAGQLLTKMIEAMGLTRGQVYICNVIKHRPPDNRTPLPEEVAACLPYLEEQIRVIQPKVICVLGSVAAKALFGPHVSIMKIRGEVREYGGIPLVPTFHPAYLLRNPEAKRPAWEDLKKVKRILLGQGA